MGVSIDMHIYDYFELVKQIKAVVEENEDRIPEGRTVDEFVEKVLPEFGVRSADKFITLWNERTEDYNAGVELFRAVELYFNVEDVFLDGYGYFSGANASEVLEELGLEAYGEDIW